MQQLFSRTMMSTEQVQKFHTVRCRFAGLVSASGDSHAISMGFLSFFLSGHLAEKPVVEVAHLGTQFCYLAECNSLLTCIRQVSATFTTQNKNKSTEWHKFSLLSPQQSYPWILIKTFTKKMDQKKVRIIKKSCYKKRGHHN